MQITTSLYDTRSKQVYGWHIQILYIFLIYFHIKYFLFWVTVLKNTNLTRFAYLQEFYKTEKKNCAGWNWSGPEATDSISHAPATDEVGASGPRPIHARSEQKRRKRVGLLPELWFELWTCRLKTRNRQDSLDVGSYIHVVWPFLNQIQRDLEELRKSGRSSGRSAWRQDWSIRWQRRWAEKMRMMDFETCAATALICCRPWPRPGLGDAEVVVADVLDELQGVGADEDDGSRPIGGTPRAQLRAWKRKGWGRG
jgi:hypothetical protein